MNNQKVGNFLNLAMEATERERETNRWNWKWDMMQRMSAGM